MGGWKPMRPPNPKQKRAGSLPPTRPKPGQPSVLAVTQKPATAATSIRRSKRHR
jgi:hypothetical protein